MGRVALPQAHCGKCGHTWVPRVDRVVICPKCKSHKAVTVKPAGRGKG